MVCSSQSPKVLLARLDPALDIAAPISSDAVASRCWKAGSIEC